MTVSILQPSIERGCVSKNTEIIQKLVDSADGELLVLAEYALTGSLVLDKNADVQKWADESENALRGLSVPNGKSLLVNSLIRKDGSVYNACVLLPGNEIVQLKSLPDETETAAGISAGNGNKIVRLHEKNVMILICSDITGIDKISTDETDVIFFIYHFTAENYRRHMANLIKISAERSIPIIASSLTSDKNYGHSAYVNGGVTVALGSHEGILNITI